MKPISEVIELLHHNGSKLTPQRRAILEILEQNKSHPTAEMIYQNLVERMPDVSRTTVYNTLNEFKELGVVDQVNDLGENSMRYDSNTKTHHHLYCISCHTLIDIEQDFDSLQLSSQTSQGFQILREQVTFYGYCPKCQSEAEL